MNVPPPLLVVEDDPEIARALRRELATYSIPTTVTRTVRETAQLADAFAVAIIDINLPDGNGLDAFEELRAGRKVHAAVFFSASKDAADLSRARRLGKFVSKSEGVPAAVQAALSLGTVRPPQSGTRPSSPDLFPTEEHQTGTNKA